MAPFLICILAGHGAAQDSVPAGLEAKHEASLAPAKCENDGTDGAVPQPGGEPPAALPVPEPGALLLVGTGLVGLALTVRHRKRRT